MPSSSCPSFVHPDYWQLLGSKPPAPPPAVTDLHVLRKTTNATTKTVFDAIPLPDGMDITTSTATSADGTEFEITRFAPLSTQEQQQENPGTPQRAIIFAFGGGLVAGTVPIWRHAIADFAERAGTQVFAPAYRLAPEDPYPAAVDDVHAAVAWVQARAPEFRVDPARLVAFGVSAGGNLVAAAALRARNEGMDPPIAAMLLRYPMLDDRTRVGEGDPRLAYLTWRPEVNALAWEAYLAKVKAEGGESADDSIPYTAAPGRAQDLRGLPATFIGVGDLDLFCEESVAFAERLEQQGVRAKAVVYRGVPHGFDMVPSFSSRQELWNDEIAFIQQI
ncbi:Alpha/Beta hydrolase protein [Apiospora aurea]|uniref:Alpha/Beta hydrolase protein n=1 Tax=Apiospora aurea TaxID=335848 RepID=A0ABR1Q5F1_9PEZI